VTDQRELSPTSVRRFSGRCISRTDAHDQIEMYIRDNPPTTVLIAVGIGYVLGKMV
jgi:ElaB/YqjD/DUF883 family membrane-anchored ribosome-binding protein